MTAYGLLDARCWDTPLELLGFAISGTVFASYNYPLRRSVVFKVLNQDRAACERALSWRRVRRRS